MEASRKSKPLVAVFRLRILLHLLYFVIWFSSLHHTCADHYLRSMGQFHPDIESVKRTEGVKADGFELRAFAAMLGVLHDVQEVADW